MVKIKDLRSEIKELDLDTPGMKVLMAKGGKGGRGNWHFKSSTNTTPRVAEGGIKGEEKELELELKLLADVGLVGLPNAGKSTLLSVLTKARPKIADYPFTTLEPNLGVMEFGDVRSKILDHRSVVVADIPGLFEGASQGKGLGDEFLRHAERTKELVHLVGSWDDYQVVRKELGEYSGRLLTKKEIVVLSKADLLAEEEIDKIKKEFAKKGIEPEVISAATGRGVEELKNRIIKIAG